MRILRHYRSRQQKCMNVISGSLHAHLDACQLTGKDIFVAFTGFLLYRLLEIRDGDFRGCVLQGVSPLAVQLTRWSHVP